jgi:hypothetical protein
MANLDDIVSKVKAEEVKAQGFISKYKWYLVAGAAALVVLAILVF